jgi:hypothetical protein
MSQVFSFGAPQGALSQNQRDIAAFSMLAGSDAAFTPGGRS